MRQSSAHPLVLFDGVCGLCNGFVDFLLRWDRHARLRFAPLQGTTARDVLGRPSDADLSTVVLILDGRMYERSEAALRTIALLGGFWKLILVARLVPRPLCDWVYDRVAQRRYRWFGKRESCRIPTPEERPRFLP